MSQAMITVSGNVTREPNIRNAGQSKVMNFSIPTDFGWGERKTTTWWNIEVWLSTEKMENYFSHAIGKGAKVVVSGEPYADQYESNGEKRTSLKIRASKVDILVPAPTEMDVTEPRQQKQSELYEDDCPF